jgi:peptidoglycan/LPS O-acetylase OafA/YrhL
LALEKGCFSCRVEYSINTEPVNDIFSAKSCARTLARGLVMNSGTSDFLNASRWIAAFFVVFAHVFAISTAYYDRIEHPSLFMRGGNFFAGYGHTAVVVFFVISGYLIGGRAILSFNEKGFGGVSYFVHRFSRIYTVLIPALIFGYILDRLGIEFFNASGVYNHPERFYGNIFGNDMTKHLSFAIFAGNLLQLQTITVSSLGSNAPLWSLANEWWYYVLFGFGMIAYRSGPMLTRVVVGGAIVAIIMVLPLRISLWLVVWGVGAAAAVLDRHWAGWPFFAGATILATCLVAVRWLYNRSWLFGLTSPVLASEFALDLAVALGYAIVLLCAKNLKGRLKFWSLHRALASCSYTMYVVHFPAMVFLAAFMKDVLDIDFMRQPDVTTAIYAGALLAMLYGCAWIFAAFTEAHTGAVRSRLGQIIPALLYQADFFIRRNIFARIRSYTDLS